MRIGQLATLFLAVITALFALAVHALTYQHTTYFHGPSKGVAQPAQVAFMALVLITLLSFALFMPSPWVVRRLIGPPRHVNYVVTMAGVVGLVAATYIFATGFRNVLHGPTLLNGSRGYELVTADKQRQSLTEPEYFRLKAQEDNQMGDLYYRAISAGVFCLTVGAVGYGIWYILAQPSARIPIQARSYFDMS